MANSIGHVIIDLTTIDSTNNYAIRLIEEGMAEHGMVIRADYQTAGKGQLGNTWYADEGKNLLCSIILDMTAFKLSKQFLLNKYISVCITEILTTQLEIDKICIKWPNDIYADKSKIAGILIENIIRGSEWKYAVVGIGLNVNQPKMEALKKATSILIETGKIANINQVLKKFLKLLEMNFNTMINTPYTIEEKYQNTLLLIGQNISIKKNHEVYDGTLSGVDDDGNILIKIKDKIKKYRHKEIELLLD